MDAVDFCSLWGFVTESVKLLSQKRLGGKSGALNGM